LLRVYAEQGEYILMGSSTVGVAVGNIELFEPGRISGSVANEVIPATADFSCTQQQPGRGFINNRAQELAGPASVDGTGNTGGYQPCFYQATTTGVYYVAIYGPSGKNSNANPNIGVVNDMEVINTQPAQRTGISAWDVTVRATPDSVVDLTGRLHTFHMALNMGRNQVNLHSRLYPVTVDGFRYQIELNGVDPFGFSLFGSQLGNLDSDGETPLYHTLIGTDGTLATTLGGTISASPQYPLFFNEIDERALPSLPIYNPFSGIQTGTGFPTTALLPQVSTPVFAGSVDGITSSVGAGGVFTFESSLPS